MSRHAPGASGAGAQPLQRDSELVGIVERDGLRNRADELANVGGDGLNSAFAQFTPITAGTSSIGGPGDAFGYRVIDSRNSACRFQAIDMSAASIASSNSPDDGVTSALAVGGAAPFHFYGQNVIY